MLSQNEDIINVSNPSKKLRSHLLRSEALQRSQCVRNATYFISLTFSSSDEKYYQFSEKIFFGLSEHFKTYYAGTQDNFFIDCAAKTITKLIINGSILTNQQIAECWKENRLYLQEGLLNIQNKTGTLNYVHSLFIEGTNAYGLDNYGCVRLKRKRVFIYTLLPTNNAHRVYTCFDQPDIKAGHQLTVKCPSDWIFVANEQELLLEKDTENKIWEAPATPPIPTYIFGFALGELSVIDSKQFQIQQQVPNSSEQTPQKIPMRLFCLPEDAAKVRQSAEEIFELVLLGIDFYEELFGVRFPLKKYDQLFAPELSWTGMENYQIVSLTQSYAFGDGVASDKRTQRCLTILHELSHSYFGNYVTMRWWDDIWLNESFASFIAHHCLSCLASRHPHIAQKFQDPNIRFLYYKRSGYNLDASPNTHPIAQIVETTENSLEIFDGITYNKGAAVLKQLVCLIGVEQLAHAVRYYFERFAYSNADMRDFFTIISEYVNKNCNTLTIDIQTWMDDWICQPSLNMLKVVEQPVPQQSTEYLQQKHTLIIEQQAVDPAVCCLLRQHFFTVCVYTLDEQNCLRKTILECKIARGQKSTEISESFYPRGVLLNQGDEGYFLWQMDTQSIGFFTENCALLAEPLEQTILLYQFQDLFEESKLKFQQLYSLCLTLIQLSYAKQNEHVLQKTLTVLSSTLHLLQNVMSESYYQQIFEYILEILGDTQLAKDLQLVFRDFLATFARSDDAVLQMRQWCQGNLLVIQHVPSSNTTLGHVLDNVFYRQLLTPEERNNIAHFEIGRQPYANFCQGSQLRGVQAKKDAWEKIAAGPPADEGRSWTQQFFRGLNNPYDKEGLQVLTELFFRDIDKIFKQQSEDYAKLVFGYLFPWGQELSVLREGLLALLQQQGTLHSNLMRYCKKNLQYVQKRLTLAEYNA